MSVTGASATKRGFVTRARLHLLFCSVESKQRNWLSENDVSFFTGGGPSEAGAEDRVSAEAQAVVQVGGGWWELGGLGGR